MEEVGIWDSMEEDVLREWKGLKVGDLPEFLVAIVVSSRAENLCPSW